MGKISFINLDSFCFSPLAALMTITPHNLKIILKNDNKILKGKAAAGLSINFIYKKTIKTPVKMSLVAYGSSDESENEEDIAETVPVEKKAEETATQKSNSDTKLLLPSPKEEEVHKLNGNGENDSEELQLNFDALPKPLELKNSDDVKETDSLPLPKKVDYSNVEKPPTKKKGPAKIIIPSLANFQDDDEDDDDDERRPACTTKHPSQKGSGLIGILPPPKGSLIGTKVNSMIPNVLTKKPSELKPQFETKSKLQQTRIVQKTLQSKSTPVILKSLTNYNSDSEDEDDKQNSALVKDYFSLSTPSKIPDEHLPPLSNEDIRDINIASSNKLKITHEDSDVKKSDTNTIVSSTVMNLPKSEILLKNKVDIGPKLPVPEQECHLDKAGNVIINEQSIQYLCGRQGAKRKRELENIEIIDINGEDMKPDEREWMVKALTEEQVHRPISVGAGPSGTSKKKHQITYLAHQAKAMELELKNQWAANKANRQQTRSKYGF